MELIGLMCYFFNVHRFHATNCVTIRVHIRKFAAIGLTIFACSVTDMQATQITVLLSDYSTVVGTAAATDAIISFSE